MKASEFWQNDVGQNNKGVRQALGPKMQFSRRLFIILPQHRFAMILYLHSDPN